MGVALNALAQYLRRKVISGRSKPESSTVEIVALAKKVGCGYCNQGVIRWSN